MSELIDRQAFIEQERRLYCEDCDRRKGKKNGKLTVCYEIGEAPCRSCWLDDALGDLEDFPTASPWHRAEDELPPNAKHPGAFCPKVRVLTRWGVSDGWFNPDMGRNGLWCVLLWFFMGTWKEDDIDFERGDRPKMVWLSQNDVIAWMPIEPPKEDA